MPYSNLVTRNLAINVSNKSRTIDTLKVFFIFYENGYFLNFMSVPIQNKNNGTLYLLYISAVPNLFLLTYSQAEKIKLAYPFVSCEKLS